jgi:hypothetical protein
MSDLDQARPPERRAIQEIPRIPRYRRTALLMSCKINATTMRNCRLQDADVAEPIIRAGPPWATARNKCFIAASGSILRHFPVPA